MMRYHLTYVRMSIVKKEKTNTKFCIGCREKETLAHCWEYKLGLPLWRTVWGSLKKSEGKGVEGRWKGSGHKLHGDGW